MNYGLSFQMIEYITCYDQNTNKESLEADSCMSILLDDNIWNEFNILTFKLILLDDSLKMKSMF